MTVNLHLHHPPLWRRINRTMPRAFVVLAAGVLMAVILWGCAPISPQAQRVVDVLCERDAALQPVVVPVVAMAAPATGPAAPVVAGALAADTILVHPAVIAACAKYHSKPAAVVEAVPPGAVVADPVAVRPGGA